MLGRGWQEAGCSRRCGVDGSCRGGSTQGRRRVIDENQLGTPKLTREAEKVCPASFLAGQTSHVVDLAGDLSKLAPAMRQMVREHQSIRADGTGHTAGDANHNRRREHPKTSSSERKPPTLPAGPSKPRPDRLALDTSDSLASCENAVSSSATTHHRPARFG